MTSTVFFYMIHYFVSAGYGGADNFLGFLKDEFVYKFDKNHFKSA